MKFEDHKICATCKHWSGDKEEVRMEYEEYSISLDLKRGWAKDGPCEVICRSVNIEIAGNAYVNLTTDGNFGCLRYESD